MNTPILGLRVASAIFGLMFLGQLVRLIARVAVTIGGVTVPFWPSGVAVLVLGGLGYWLWRLSLEPGKADTPAAPPPQ